MNITDILKGLQTAAEAVQGLAPLTAAIGLPSAQIAAAAGAVSDIAGHVSDRIKTGEIAATSENQAELSDLIDQLNAMAQAAEDEALS